MNENKENIERQSLINTNIPLKLRLSYNYNSFIASSSEVNIIDPIYKLLLDYSDIEKIQKINDKKEMELLCKFLYFNRKKVHEILLDSDKTIHFEYEENKNLSFYFYLVLLIKDMPYILNYTFDLEYIKEINDKQDQNKEIYKKLIISKIIIELVNEYKAIYDYFGDENEEKLNIIINMNLSIIKDNINAFKEMEINWTEVEFCSGSIDLIYIEIIISLIKQKKLEDYEYSYELIKQLNIDSIDINSAMYDKLYNLLNKDEDYINDYIISNKEELVNENKINFYYILLKYILKHPIYIFQIPFLMKTKRYIIDSFKSNNNIIYTKKLKNNLVDRLKYILKIFTNSSNFELKKEAKQSVKGFKGVFKNAFKKNNKNDNSMDMEQKSSKKEIDDYSELHNLLYVKDLLNNKQTKSLMTNSLKNMNYYFDNDKFLNLLKVGKKDVEKFKEIITNDEWKKLLKGDKVEFKDIIKNVFYFEESNDELNKLKKKLPMEVNKQSIEYFKNWVNNERNVNKSEQKQN